VGNTITGTVTKMLTLVPILVAIYFFDSPKLYTLLISDGEGGFFAVTASLFLLGVVLKRRILRTRLELSRISFVWGLLLLGGGALLYVYGSYSSNSAWYYYESLLLLTIGYVALRIGTGILRSLAPLLAILILAVPPVGFFLGSNDQAITVFLSADLVFLLFLTFVGLRLKVMIIPLAIMILGLVARTETSFPLSGHQVATALFVPLPLLGLLVPRVRSFTSLPSGAAAETCPGHHLFLDGFCSVCGSRIARTRTGENVGIWGFLAVLAVAALLIFTTVPALGLAGGLPYDAYYSSHGYSGTITPPTPLGWQINSTAVYKSISVSSPQFTNDAYAIKQVYVPLYHPETKNYTVYYELSALPTPYTNNSFGNDIPGWNRGSNNFTQVGPFQGHLTTYVASDRVMLAYQGQTSMLFVDGGLFVRYYVGFGFMREFRNSNVTADTTQFLGDLNALWLPGITRDTSFSGWTDFLFTLDQGGVLVSTLVLLASSVALIAWAAHRASLLDERLDRFLTLASAQTEQNWSYLSGLLKRAHHAATGQELALAVGLSELRETEQLDVSMRELEHRRLVRRSLVERGRDIVSVWRTVV
jgi:hypothetical protein